MPVTGGVPALLVGPKGAEPDQEQSKEKHLGRSFLLITARTRVHLVGDTSSK